MALLCVKEVPFQLGTERLTVNQEPNGNIRDDRYCYSWNAEAAFGFNG